MRTTSAKIKMAAVLEMSGSVENDENLLRTIFSDSFPESWRDNPDFAAYLSELSSSSVERLSRESERLVEERTQILEQTQDLAFHNYKTFIKTADCSREIFQDFISVEKHVESLLEVLPGFSEKCSNFMKSAQDINKSRRLNSLTLSRHTQLLEILEIPQLMDTCVRNSYYEEALELAFYVRRLEKKLSNIPVVQKIVEEVQSSTQLMLSQLLQQLRSSIQLPACLRVIGFLRRLDVFSESELRIKFLQARDAWLQSVLSSIPREEPYYHITKTIEASRVHLFDVVTQYRAIFSDDDPILSMEDEDSPAYSNLFHCWIVQKISHFLKTLEFDLERGVGGRLDSLLGQCMYFGLSFSRVGADFRGLLPPLFQAASLKVFTNTVDDVTRRFEETMSSYTLQPAPSTLTATVLATTSMQGEDGSRGLSPPVVLLEHPPLAGYVNGVLSAFNGLRHCAPLSLAESIKNVLRISLKSVVETTCSYHRTEAVALSERERSVFARFCAVLARDLIPYMNRCMEAVFPPDALSLVVRKQRPRGLDTKELVKPLLPMIPQEESVDDSLKGKTTEETKTIVAKKTENSTGDELSYEKEQSAGIETQDKPVPTESRSVDDTEATTSTVGSDANTRTKSEKPADKTSVKTD